MTKVFERLKKEIEFIDKKGTIFDWLFRRDVIEELEVWEVILSEFRDTADPRPRLLLKRNRSLIEVKNFCKANSQKIEYKTFHFVNSTYPYLEVSEKESIVNERLKPIESILKDP